MFNIALDNLKYTIHCIVCIIMFVALNIVMMFYAEYWSIVGIFFCYDQELDQHRFYSSIMF